MNLIAGDVLSRAAFYSAVCLLALCVTFFASLLMVQIARARARRRREAEAEAIRPELNRLIVQFLSGSPDDTAIRGYLESRPQDVTETLLRFQNTVAGGARDRLCHLALDLGLVHQWTLDGASGDVLLRRRGMARLAFVCAYEPCRRVAGELLSRALEDSDQEVRLAAARGLVQTGVQTDIEDVLLVAIGPNPFVRALLTEELRRHAMELCAEVIPEVLASGKIEYVRAALEIVTAWQRAIPLDRLREFLDHGDRGIRVLALRLAPMAAPDQESRRAIVRALEEDDLEIRTLATVAAGRLKLAEALPQLVQCMRRGPIEAARRAGAALATMPPAGHEALRELAEGEGDLAARAAREVLAGRKGAA